MVLQQIVTAYFAFWRKCGYTLRQKRVSKGYPFGTRLCLQSVVCYTLCRRCCENGVAAGEGKGIWSSRKTRLWLRGVEPQAQGWFRQQTGRIWKPPSLALRRTSGHFVPNLWTHSRKSRRIFLSKLKWAGSHFRAFPPWLPFSKDRRDCQRRRILYAPFILTIDWCGWLCYLPDKWKLLKLLQAIKYPQKLEIAKGFVLYFLNWAIITYSVQNDYCIIGPV